MMWGYDGSWSWGGMAMMTVSLLFWLAIVGLFFFLLVRWLRVAAGSGAHLFGAGTHPSTMLSARQLLEQRYARGEIDETTFQRMRDQLTTPASQ
ncbi:MAG: SHOCT domain-containing protein [Ktedonobacterales bacterium]|nr:SHOCT domain-containing protein [Ktedonobacterales bacterium]